FSLLLLFQYHHGNQTHPNKTTADKRMFVKDENIQRVTVLRVGAGNEAKVDWKLHFSGQRFAQLEKAMREIVSIFEVTSFWRFDDSIEQAFILFGERLELKQTIFHFPAGKPIDIYSAVRVR